MSSAVQTRQLPRVLSFFDLSVLSSASMAPAYSLASTMGAMVAAAGGVAPLALLALVAIMACMAVAYARLSAIAPNAGSSYAWIRMGFGTRAGVYGAWLLLLSNVFATMATALPAATYTLDLLARFGLVSEAYAASPIWIAVVGVVWITGSCLLLYSGMRPTALLTTIFLGTEMLVLGASAFAAATSPAAGTHALSNAPLSAGWGGIFAAMVLGIWMTDGWEVSASTSEESKGSKRAPGRGGMTGLLITSAILFVCMQSYMHVGSVAGFVAHQDDALTYVGTQLGRAWWMPAIVFTVLVSSSAALWTTMLYLSRSMYAMGRDGVLPHALGRLDARSEPRVALVVVAAMVAFFTLLTGIWQTAAQALTFVLNGSSIFLGLLFAFTALAAVRIFWNDRGRERLSGVVIPAAGLLALLGVITVSVIQGDAGLKAFAVGGALAGVPFMLWRRGAG